MKPIAKSFHFVSWNWEKSVAIFNYRIEFKNREPLEFSERLELPASKKTTKIPMHLMESLHLILGISYYKLYCPAKVVSPYLLNKDQAEFWSTVYKKGLGEFSYRNKIDPKKIAKFPSVKAQIISKTSNAEGAISILDDFKKSDGTKNAGALLGIGGGKDSIVARELLRDYEKRGLKLSAYLLETEKLDPISEKVIEKMKIPTLKIRRHLDPKIFQKHEGSYNGHIPISAIVAFTGLLAAALSGNKYVIVGNEYSSNFGNLKYKGLEINHQWSKSAEFESLFQNYCKKYITPDITYFSLLRQFYEIRIAEIFARYKKYFKVFSSCNGNFKVNKERQKLLWCGECAKCVFTFTILSPYIPHKELVNIFGKDLFADKKLKQMFNDITGCGKMKPFDCVGTFMESRAALGEKIPEVFQTVTAPTLPTQFKLAGIKNLSIIGYGREGKITEKFLRKYYPKLAITILDQSTDKNYLARQNEFDFAIKTPGIPKSKITIPYTTATNLFFALNKNFTIGVTGSKGKSTTTTLIYEILKAAGKKVRLLGNIGNPMLATLLSKPDPNEIFVIELSSYMLEDIEYSPNIALLLNLFPEHMNYHGDVKKYYAAKQNIFAFQKPSDIAIRPPFKQKIPTEKIPLLGDHNRSNIKAAIAVARALHIQDRAIAKAIENFKPLPHRLEFVAEKNGIKFYDDAISTTPESTIEAIKTLKKVDTIFLGGEDRGYDFKELVATLSKYKARNIVLFPDSGKRILEQLSPANFTILETRSMKEAVAFAFANTSPGKICLLSTASPSYSLWKNFEEKGNEFKACIGDKNGV